MGVINQNEKVITDKTKDTDKKDKTISNMAKVIQRKKMSILTYQKKYRNLQSKVKRLNKSKDKLNLKQSTFKKAVEKARQSALEELLDGLGDISVEMIKLIINKSKKLHWAKQSPIINELCLSLYFKSPAAYKMLRKSNFAKFPHPSTLRK